MSVAMAIICASEMQTASTVLAATAASVLRASNSRPTEPVSVRRSLTSFFGTEHSILQISYPEKSSVLFCQKVFSKTVLKDFLSKSLH